MHRGGRASQVIDLIHLQEYWFNHIVTNELEPRIPKVVNHILLPSREEIIDHDNVVSSSNELIHQMTPDKSSPAGDHDPQPPLPERRRHAADLEKWRRRKRDLVLALRRDRTGTAIEGGPRWGGIGVGGADSREGGLEDEERGTDQDSDEDEEEPLLFEEVVDGSGERSGGVLKGFRWVRRGRPRRRGLLVAPVADGGRLLV